MASNRRMLCVGLVCFDSIFHVLEYPTEDADIRASLYTPARGGNAGSNSVILKQLAPYTGIEFLGCIADSSEGKFCIAELHKYNVLTENCIVKPGLAHPITCCIISEANGSRTLIHHKGMFPEISLEEFKQLDLRLYSWLHFEGRVNVAEMQAMIEYAYSWCNLQSLELVPTSIEFEKARSFDYKHLLSVPDVAILSMEYAQHNGYKSMEETVIGLSAYIKVGAVIVCTWGSEGACAGLKMNQNDILDRNTIIKCPSFPPEAGVKDTLGAGDTFLASFIFALNQWTKDKWSENLHKALEFACLVAGHKCGKFGFLLDQTEIAKFKEKLK